MASTRRRHRIDRRGAETPSARHTASTDVAPRRHRRDTTRLTTQARAAEDRAEADFEGYADVAEPPASDVEARLAAARDELARLEDDKRAKKAARNGALAPLDNAEEAPRKRMADASGIVSKAKQKKAKKKPAARKKKRARDDEEPSSPKRAREDPEDWDFDNGVDE